MNIFLKRIIIVLFVTNLMSCNMFGGVLFPKVKFSFTDLGERIPSSADARLAAGAEYPQTFKFYFLPSGNSFTKPFYITIFINKPYKSLYIKEMSYEYDNGKGKGIFLSDKTFKIPIDEYLFFNGWYWGNSLGEPFFEVNFEKVFIDKKPGDEFDFKLALIYSFDEEPEETQIFNYNVTAIKGEYTSIFTGFY